MMTNAELYDVAMKASVGVLILAAWTYVVLEQRDTRRRLDRHRADLTNHARRLTLHEHRAAATTVGQPMATVGRPRPRDIADALTRSAMAIPAPRWVNRPAPWGKEEGPELFVTQAGLRTLMANATQPAPACVTDPDPTLRLTRPPSVLPPEQSDLQRVLADAGRPLTATEMADRLGRQPWDLLPLIDRDMTAGRIRTAPGHTAGRTAYQLADTDTVRMPKMPVLPGLRP